MVIQAGQRASTRFTPPYSLRIYLEIRASVFAAGFVDDYEWSESIKPPEDSTPFARELIFVICNSGMAAKAARPVYERIARQLDRGFSAHDVFGHKGKSDAIDWIWVNKVVIFDLYRMSSDKVRFLRDLPWIGPITCFHAAKNFGLDVCKPDRHIQRIADAHGVTPMHLCKRLARASGDRIATVDYILWRAAEMRLIDTRSLTKCER